MKKDNLVDSGASIQMMSKSAFAHEAQDTIWKSANGSTTTTEEATVCITDMDTFITVQNFGRLDVLSQGK